VHHTDDPSQLKLPTGAEHGPLKRGTTMHVSRPAIDRDAWYRLGDETRAALMYAPTVSASRGYLLRGRSIRGNGRTQGHGWRCRLAWIVTVTGDLVIPRGLQVIPSCR
jgi:hypothetical protein